MSLHTSYSYPIKTINTDKTFSEHLYDLSKKLSEIFLFCINNRPYDNGKISWVDDEINRSTRFVYWRM